MLPAAVIREAPVDARLLRSLFLFETLPPQQLEALATNTVLADYDAGIVSAEGDPARYFFILVEGELAVSKRVGERDVETSRTTHRGTYCGATAAFIEHSPENYSLSVRATRPARLVRMAADFFGDFVRAVGRRFPQVTYWTLQNEPNQPGWLDPQWVRRGGAWVESSPAIYRGTRVIVGAREWIEECETLISRRGHRIAYRQRGQGPTLLLLHGFPTWSYDYADVAASGPRSASTPAGG